MYVDWRQRRTACDEHGDPVLDGEGRRKLEGVQRDRPVVRLRDVFNVEQTEGWNCGRSRSRRRSGKDLSAPKR